MSGSATVAISSNTCTGTSLAYGASCTYVITVSDTTNESSKQINVGISATYTNSSGTTTYSRVITISYTSIMTASLSVSSVLTCALKNTSSISCWGSNSTGGGGNGTTAVESVPMAISTTNTSGVVSSWSKVVTNGTTTCAIAGAGTNAGNIYCWGTGESGQIGNGASVSVTVPTLVTKPSTVTSWTDIQIRGTSLVCAMGTTNTTVNGITSGSSQIYCWGRANAGLGGGSFTESAPKAISTAGNITSWNSMYVGATAVCAIGSTATTSGVMYCWGYGAFGQMGNGTTTSVNTTPQAVSAPTTGAVTWSSVSIANRTVCAITTSGALYCWGWNSTGQVGINTTSTSESIPVAVSTTNTGTTTWSSVQTFNQTVCAITATSTSGIANWIYCWGLGTGGQIGNSASANKLIPTAITNPGGVSTWSSLSTPQNDTTTNVCCAISGTVTSGTAGWIYCWGTGTSGQIGNGASSSVNLPTAVSSSSGITSWYSVATSSTLVCAMPSSPNYVTTVYCWGLGTSGQIGNGATSTVNVPTATSSLP